MAFLQLIKAKKLYISRLSKWWFQIIESVNKPHKYGRTTWIWTCTQTPLNYLGTKFIIKTNCMSVSCQNCLSINTFWIFVAKFWCIYEYLLTVCTLESDEYLNLFIFSKKIKIWQLIRKMHLFFKGNVSSWIFFLPWQSFFIIIFHINFQMMHYF